MTDNHIDRMVSELTNDIHAADALEFLSRLPDESIHFVMFSPPYWGLRDYGDDEVEVAWGDDDCEHNWHPIPPEDDEGHLGRFCAECGSWHGQFGREPNPDRFIENLVEVASEVQRVLRPDGSWWLNLGDAYSDADRRWSITEGEDGFEAEREHATAADKCKMFLPQRAAIELVRDGWILRNDAAWQKTNPMPESVDDRLSTTFEWLFHFTKRESYYYDLDAIREPYTSVDQPSNTDDPFGGMIGKNPGDVIALATDHSDEGHFAVYPPELVVKPLEATCPPKVCAGCGAPYERAVEEVERPDVRDRSTDRTSHNDTDWNNNRNSWAGTPKERHTVGWEQTCDCEDAGSEPGIALDPMCGRGTTCQVAAERGRRYIGADVNPEYVDIAREYVPRYRQQTIIEYD